MDSFTLGNKNFNSDRSHNSSIKMHQDRRQSNYNPQPNLEKQL